MVCAECGKSKPESDYYQFAGRPNGRKCKACVRIAKRAWYHRNRPLMLKQLKEYRTVNRASVKAKQRECYQRRRDYYIGKSADWAHANVAARRAIARRYNQQHPEVCKANKTKARSHLYRCYVNDIITRGTCLSRSDVPAGLYEVRKALITARRIEREIRRSMVEK